MVWAVNVEPLIDTGQRILYNMKYIIMSISS